MFKKHKVLIQIPIFKKIGIFFSKKRPNFNDFLKLKKYFFQKNDQILMIF